MKANKFVLIVTIVLTLIFVLALPTMSVAAKSAGASLTLADIDWGKILTGILTILLPPLAAALAAFLIAKAKEAWENLKLNNPTLAEQLQEAAQWAVKLYKALEDSGTIPHWNYSVIRDYLVKMARFYIDTYCPGLKNFDLAAIVAEIEKAIADMGIDFSTPTDLQFANWMGDEKREFQSEFILDELDKRYESELI